MIKFVLFVNKQGQTRLSQYYEYSSVEERVSMEADIVRKCLSRNEEAVSSRASSHSAGLLTFSFHWQCSFMEYKNFKVVYRRYASLYFIVGIDNEEVCSQNICCFDLMVERGGGGGVGLSMNVNSDTFNVM